MSKHILLHRSLRSWLVNSRTLAAAVLAGSLAGGLSPKLLGAEKAGGPAGGKGLGPVSVAVVAVQHKEIPVYLDGLGTVQAYNTVTVCARVDGQLDKVAFTEGQEVATGDVLAQIDARPYKATLDQAKAKKGEDEAQLANARVQLARDQELLKNRILAQQDYDTQQTTVDQLRATVEADQAAIDSAQVQLDYTTVRAPLSGRTGVRIKDQGNIVHATDTNGLVVITQIRPISVIFTLPQQKLNAIRNQCAKGDLSVITVGEDGASVGAQGKLSVIDNQIDTSTGTIRLKATFPNEGGQLWPGQFVNTRLLLQTAAGMAVPEAAVQRGPQGAYVFVLQGSSEDQSVDVRAVTTGPSEAGLVLIESGLSEGEQVVTEGQYRLQAGTKVKVRAPRSAPKKEETAS